MFSSVRRVRSMLSRIWRESAFASPWGGVLSVGAGGPVGAGGGGTTGTGSIGGSCFGSGFVLFGAGLGFGGAGGFAAAGSSAGSSTGGGSGSGSGVITRGGAGGTSSGGRLTTVSPLVVTQALDATITKNAATAA